MTRVAAVDCGTNSLRLLIADVDASTGESHDVVRTTQIVRLGQDVDRTGVFAEAALRRTFAMLDEYATVIESSSVDAVRLVATSAARDVANRDEFAAGVRSRIGVEPEVITGDEEARLAYDGATRDLRGAAVDGVEAPIVVCDIGGGSTEIVCRRGESLPVVGESLDVGSVRLTERYLAGDPPTADEIAAAAAEADRLLGTLTVCSERPGTLIGVAGTVTTVAAMAMRLEAYDPDAIHRSWIDADSIDRAASELLAMTVEDRLRLGFMAPGRADVIGGGALLLARVLQRLEVDRMLASEHDILDGIAWSLA